MLGEIALWSFVVLLLTGTFLTLFFDPSMGEVVYNGSYDPLRGVRCRRPTPRRCTSPSTSAAACSCGRSTTGRRCCSSPRCRAHDARLLHRRVPQAARAQLGDRRACCSCSASLEGFAGYSLPDDLLSGTGLRIADGDHEVDPGGRHLLSFFLFGGEFPGDAIIPRLYIIHVLLIPGILLALIGVHMLLLVYQKHTQYPGPGRTERQRRRLPDLPVYAAKAGGFFFIVFGVTALMGGLFRSTRSGCTARTTPRR
jgi:ubiquinol-cytochrome c reductase cytochrome b subunit